jgi:serine phosphatase RsbU (regulator of sigma subunit)/anti-sigma regulatory factor (Ser/Thr protein kinase)
VPLIGQGELLGALYLGHRLSDQPYSSDDRRLMESLASQVAPAIRVAQLVRQQQVETEERERIQQELKVAALIQQTLLPRELPARAGWTIDAFYRPARAVGGDFYDFIELDDGRLGVVIGDVTDKGVPAALVMATCRSMLRAAAHSQRSPGEVLAEVNDSLVPEIPPAMFVTCLYAMVDTATGELTFANAGHNLPYVRTEDGVVELRATGMPLGLMPGMTYEENICSISADQVVVLTSDGITEAHSPEGEMYGFSRLMGQVAAGTSGDPISELVGDLERFTGPDAEQEDDITLVVLQRTSSAEASASAFDNGELLISFRVSSEEGNERIAITRVSEAVSSLGIDREQVDRLKTAVGEAVMNAMEHGNEYQPELSVDIEVRDTPRSVVVRVTDHGDGPDLPQVTTPDIEAKIKGEQTPRGWGLFLIEQMVDELHTENGDGTHTVELVIDKKGAGR